MVTPYFVKLVAGNVMHSASVDSLPATYYVALSTTVPADDGPGFTEVSGGSYARAVFGPGSVPEDGLVSNLNDIEYQECTESWGVVKAFALYDTAIGGNLLTWDKLNTPQTVVAGNQVRFKPGALKTTFSADTV